MLPGIQRPKTPRKPRNVSTGPRTYKLGLAKVRTRIIVKSNPEIRMIAGTIPEILTKAAEYLIQMIVRKAVLDDKGVVKKEIDLPSVAKNS
eukprot:gnl/Chilomastix_caulleri/1765.p1 GENE.gnl/Chilomastix_caulleri/1765~~gnl/Chilomastix_caulleri/1765.p1  ORF type:complete len:91 (+),score=0.40 gnl/Chilomastix_caulleri/1765:63-335(+)